MAWSFFVGEQLSGGHLLFIGMLQANCLLSSGSALIMALLKLTALML